TRRVTARPLSLRFTLNKKGPWSCQVSIESQSSGISVETLSSATPRKGHPSATSQLQQPRNAKTQRVKFTKPLPGFRPRFLVDEPRSHRSTCQKAATYGSKAHSS